MTEPYLSNESQQWIPLMDFAIKNGVSLSTLRRYIKAQKVKYKIESGRYLLLEGSLSAVVPSVGSVDLVERVNRLEKELLQTQEDLADLKMLVALIEERL